MTFNDPVAGLTAQALRRRAAFRAARRHTRLVQLLRRAIPAAAVLLVLSLVVMPFLSPLGGRLANVSIGSVGITGGKVRMETPKLSGYRKDNRPYQVTALNAFQEIRDPTQIELQTLTARIQMEREGWVTVNAKTGLFDTQKEKLRLVDDVKIRTENGHDMQMKTADVDFKSGTVVSKEPVKVSLGETTVDADTLDVKNNGELIVFAGRVKVVVRNAPAGTLAGPEREGSTPMPELLNANRVAPAGEGGNGKGQ
ncbi:LPS export ABC transporter periplasmic protein LptC [Bosea sp. (in: a-proteobacteria)]|uniref:LPS export ABC transporter periplasmic protein LptC n=1 Tax=Bosea sp. (in: a-proteobacteria) TaxID=1871050 RepID=UPI002616F5D8|nr:LPS export ABC transporter periplasmic protein LptC [Bosea sp. (in: a-proteobacteria)]MCO5091626.1 LPS export ABC transporter periplasmic protein LptC [Bosea sp. (in: a-proteobacteria)]